MLLAPTCLLFDFIFPWLGKRIAPHYTIGPVYLETVGCWILAKAKVHPMSVLRYIGIKPLDPKADNSIVGVC